MGLDSAVNFRRANKDDVDNIHKMIVDSTGGKTQLTVSSLRDDLFVKEPSPLLHGKVKSTDSSIDLDLKMMESNRPVAQVILAEVESQLVGYTLFHYYFSPWTGISAHVEDLYVIPEFRNKGIATSLVGELSKVCKEERLEYAVFKIKKSDDNLLKTLVRNGCFWMRDDETADWSLCRIKFSTQPSL